MNLDGLAAIVTGAASGLGAAAAGRLAQRGAKVAIFDLNAEAGEAYAREIGGAFFQVDIGNDASIVEAFRAAQERHGVSRVLVNCAGIAPGARTVGREASPHSIDLFRKAVEINLVGTFNMIARFAAALSTAEAIGQERGVIVNTASIAAYDGQIGQAAYAASKAGVVGLTLPVARDLAQYKIRVMTIAPGLFLTPMMQGFPQEMQDALGAQVPHPSRLGDPAEYAQLVEAIIDNPMLNGEVIRLDGALRMAPR